MTGAWKSGSARESAGAPVTEATLTDLGYARYVLTGSTIHDLADAPDDGVALPQGARLAVLVCETQAIRWVNNADAGTILSSTKGMPLATGAQFTYSGSLADFRFTEQTSGAVLHVCYFK